MNKPNVLAAVLLAAAFFAAALLDAPRVTCQILLPWLAAFSVFSTRRGACRVRGVQP